MDAFEADLSRPRLLLCSLRAACILTPFCVLLRMQPLRSESNQLVFPSLSSHSFASASYYLLFHLLQAHACTHTSFLLPTTRLRKQKKKVTFSISNPFLIIIILSPTTHASRPKSLFQALFPSLPGPCCVGPRFCKTPSPCIRSLIRCLRTVRLSTISVHPTYEDHPCRIPPRC